MTTPSKSVPGKFTYRVYACLFALVGVIVIAALAGFIDKLMARRAMGIVFGLIMVTSGNFLPKLVNPQLSGHSQSSASHRLIGWVLVLSGAALVIALLILPDALVAICTSIIGLGGLVLSGFLILGSRWSNRSLDATQSPDSIDQNDIAQSKAKIEINTFHILHGIAWVFVILLADIIWGADALKWSLIGFAVSMTIFPATLKNRPVNPRYRGDGC
jgi:small-conductance mechanosensitive channel